MSIVSDKFNTKQYEPSGKKPCVCGSGLKFKRCCAGNYSGKAFRQYRIAYSSGDYKAALMYARYHFTWYVLSHRAHTIPLLEAKKQAGLDFLAIDIEALADHLENLYGCYRALGIGAQFYNVIDSARNLIDDDRWTDKVSYFGGLWHHVEKDDSLEAFRCIEHIDIANCIDVDLLTLYLDVNPNALSQNDLIQIIDRIVENTRDPAIRIQYRCLKAIQYYLYLQDSDGTREFKDAISDYCSAPEKKKSPYGKFMLAKAYESFGTATQDDSVLAKAEETTNELIANAIENELSPNYLANLYGLHGDIQHSLGIHKEAQESYFRSLEKRQDPLTEIFIARSTCLLGDLDAARNRLNGLDDTKLSDPNKFDLALSWAILALTSLSKGDIDISLLRLRAVAASDPLFIHLRDSQLIELLEIKPHPPAKSVQLFLSKLNRYITLKPNLFGIGVDLNRVIDDFSDSNKTKK